MASIQKLSVRGVRAFSPDDEEQVIAFGFPLTIIIGKNGCGKTTIIEALKYSVTGALPPGNKSGQAFVHDPKSVGTSQVKAAVKLRFQNRAGKTMVVNRAMELTQKRTTMQFKQLDGTIKTTDDRGNRVALSHKCSELDRQIPQMLGCSKAILEHVVFCHQEDSSWPLMEGAVLKKRFDDIFDSTRYVKALDELKSTRKGFQSKVKDLNVELAELSGHKHAAGNYRQEFDKCKEQMSHIHDEIKEFEEEIDEADQKCQEYQKSLDEIRNLESQIIDKTRDAQVASTKEDAFRKNLKEDMTDCSAEDLSRMLSAYDREMKGDERKLSLAKEEVQRLESTIGKGKTRTMDLSGEKGLLLGQKKIFDDNLTERVKLMEDMATEYGLELSFSQTQQTDIISTQQSRLSSDVVNDMNLSQGTSASNVHLTIEDLDAFNRSVENKRNELQDDLKTYQKQVQRENDEMQAELSDIKAKIESHDKEMGRLKEDYLKAERELKTLPRTTSTVRGGEIEEAKKKVESFMKKVDNLNKDPERESVPEEIKAKEAKVHEIKQEIDKLAEILKDLRKVAEDQNRIKVFEEQVDSEMNAIEDIKNENDYLLSLKKVNIPDAKDKDAVDMIRDVVDDFVSQTDETSSKLAEATENLENSSSSCSKLSALLNHKKENLSQLERRLIDLKKDDKGFKKIGNVIKALRAFESAQYGESDITPSAEPEVLSEHIAKKMTEASSFIRPESKGNIIQKLKKMSIAGGNITCPCCSHKFTSKKAAEDFENNLGSFVDALIQPNKDTEKLNQSAMNNYEIWRSIVSRGSPEWMDHERISNDVSSLKSEIEEDEVKLKDLQKAREEDKNKVNELKDELAQLQEMRDLALRLKENFENIAKKVMQIEEIKLQCEFEAPKARGKSLETVELDQNELMHKKDFMTSEISNLNKKVSMMNQTINDCNQNLLKAQKVLENKERVFAREQEADTRKKELRELMNKNKTKQEKTKSENSTLYKELKTKTSKKDRTRDATDAEIDRKSIHFTNFNRDSEKIDALSKQIDSFKSGDKLQRLVKIDTEINSINKEIADNEDALDKLTPQVKSLQNKVDDQDAHKKNVESNIELLEIIASKQKIDDELDLLGQQLLGLDSESVEASHNTMQDKIRNIEVKISRCEGKKESIRSQQRDLQRRLKSKEYKDIDERHRVKMIEVETNSLAVSDLEIYYNALDKALLRYHGMKIQEINKIIKELWSNTYRGEDITNIRLTSDQESNSRSTRSYNYRVVMTKGSTELDMRGRCSAGQRVLASIVIRLALAETFGLNFGVMALDEPTTNLDFENKRGLAISLARIISERSTQDNFQLVIITHDEDFVGILKSELSAHTVPMPEKYFLVYRREANDGCYYSKVKSIDWEDI